MRIYCDSVILIYLLDTVGPLNTRAVARISTLQAAGDRIVVSDLNRLECRIKPLRTGDAASLTRCDTLFARSDIEIVPLPRAVYDRATLLRAIYNFKLGDALHLAAAIESGCDRFLTNDMRLSRCVDILIEILPP